MVEDVKEACESGDEATTKLKRLKEVITECTIEQPSDALKEALKEARKLRDEMSVQIAAESRKMKAAEKKKKEQEAKALAMKEQEAEKAAMEEMQREAREKAAAQKAKEEAESPEGGGSGSGKKKGRREMRAELEERQRIERENEIREQDMIEQAIAASLLEAKTAAAEEAPLDDDAAIEAALKASLESSAASKVFVMGLPEDASHTLIKEYFERSVGAVMDVQTQNMPQKMGPGIFSTSLRAHVTFELGGRRGDCMRSLS